MQKAYFISVWNHDTSVAEAINLYYSPHRSLVFITSIKKRYIGKKIRKKYSCYRVYILTFFFPTWLAIDPYRFTLMCFLPTYLHSRKITHVHSFKSRSSYLSTVVIDYARKQSTLL